jgi:hypothetical protein
MGTAALKESDGYSIAAVGRQWAQLYTELGAARAGLGAAKAGGATTPSG